MKVWCWTILIHNVEHLVHKTTKIHYEKLNSTLEVKQSINHIPNTHYLGEKHKLFEGLKKFWELSKAEVFDFGKYFWKLIYAWIVPITFHIKFDTTMTENAWKNKLKPFMNCFNVLSKFSDMIKNVHTTLDKGEDLNLGKQIQSLIYSQRKLKTKSTMWTQSITFLGSTSFMV